MQPHERAQFAALVSDVMAFYRRDVSDFAIGVWWQACEPFALEQVRQAFTAHAMDAERGHFEPRPSDLVRHLQGTRTDRARIAWGKVMEAMQRIGAYTSVVFDDPVIHAVVEDLGGWVKLCRGELRDLSHTEHRFCESYRAYAGRQQTPDFPAVLSGEHDAANRLAGQPCQPPVLIGDRAQAERVLSLGATGPRLSFASALALPSAESLRRLGRDAA